MDNKQIRNRYLALFLAFVMLIGILPTNIFAEPTTEAGGEPKKVDAIETDGVANEAPNAVHAYVGVQTGGSLNLPLAGATGEEFTPIAGVRGYFQWFEKWGNTEYSSPIYTAVSDASGRLNIACKPYVAVDGQIIKFDADPTASGGHEKYKFWVDKSSIPEGYQLQYITGEQMVFPIDVLTPTQGGSGSNTASNTHNNWKILLMQQPKVSMHKAAKDTPVQAGDGGRMTGTVSWDYFSTSAGVNWYGIAQHTTPAPEVVVKASYLSDYAMSRIYSNDAVSAIGGLKGPDDIRGTGWTSAQEAKLQKWIKEQVKADPDKWIAETVSAKTGPDGKYIIQFNGTWGPVNNKKAATYKREADKYNWGDAHTWTKEEVKRLGTIADKPEDGNFRLGVQYWNMKHINYDWLFVSTEGTEGLRVITPYNNNYYTAMNSSWGIHNGWSGAGFGVGVTDSTNSTLRSDFVLGVNDVNFNIVKYNTEDHTAIPGDVAETSTTGLPYSNTSDSYRIVWYDKDGKEVKSGAVQKPDSTGKLKSEPLDTKGVTETTIYTAKLYRVDSKGNNAQLIAQDSFAVDVNHMFISRYDQVTLENPIAKDDDMKGAKYYAQDLPKDLEIAEADGTISGKAKEAGLYNIHYKTVIPDEAGDVEGVRYRYMAVTDTPLKAGEVGVEYSQDVKPVPAKDPNNKDYIFKVKSVEFTKPIAGLSITGDEASGFKITGKPTEKVVATQDTLNGDPGPNVKVTYDIYKTNDKGEEYLAKKGHIDLVPLEVKSGESAKYDPKYTAVDGTVGKAATVATPKFLDQTSTADPKPEANPQPTIKKYALGTGAPEGASVDPATGVVTYKPTLADAGKTIEIPVVVTYSDDTTDETTAPINVGEAENAKYRPKYESVTAQVGHEVTVESPEFIGKDGNKANPQPKIKKYAIKDGFTPNGTISIDSSTGAIKYTAVDADKDSMVQVPVVVTYEDGSVDNTTAVINVPSDADYYKQSYKDAEGIVGTPVTTEAPTFKGAEGNDTTAPDKTKYTLGQGAPEGATIDEKTGRVTYTPKDTDAGKTVEIPVVITYPDGTTDNTKVNINVSEVTPKDVIPFLPGGEEPTTDSDGKTIPANYITVTFKSEDANKGTVKVGKIEGAEVKAKVKPGTDLTGKAAAIAKDKYGFTKWDPELGVAEAGKVYTAHFMKSGDEVVEPIPANWLKVTVKQDTASIADGTVTEKSYAVAPGDKLAAEKFPSLAGKEAQGYENPAWYVGDEKVEKPAEKAITAETTFLAKATAKTAADNTTDEVVPWVPGTDEEPTKGSDGKTIPKDYITVTFKSEDVNKGTVKVGTKEGVEVKAKVKPGTDLSKKTDIKAVAKDSYGFTVWAPELGVAQADNPYVAKFIQDGSEVKANDPIPTGWHRVTVKQDAPSIKENTVTEKTYAVKEKLSKDKLVDLTGKAADTFENPAWYDGDTNLGAKPTQDIAVSADKTIIAKADPKTAATKTADKLTPEYGDKTGTAGTAVTTDAPTFKDTDGKATTAPEGTKYKLGDGAPEGATIDENTGKVTYTPTESEVGKPVEIPVVVTYPDQSTDNAKAKINVETLPDVIDRTNNPNATTPDGYVRVTFTNGEGVNDITNNKVYDVKEGKSLTAEQYPEVTAKENYGNPVWSTPAGTAITKNTQLPITATATTPATKTSEKIKPKYEDKTGTAGTAVTTDAPTYKTAQGDASTAPEGTKYKLGDGAPEGATIDENTGKVTYTPKELEAGKPVEIPVVVTYPDQSTDNAKAKINVETLPDVIDRTNNPNATTPDGYVRVTFTNGEGVNEIENNKVYDVKSGTALTADKYPTVTAKGGYENPVWSTPAGTAITAANATITATASATSGSDTTAPAAPTVTANNDGSVDITPPTDPDTKSVDVTYTPEGATEPKTVTVTKDGNGKWKTDDSNLTVDPDSGKITIPANKVADGTEVTAKAKDGSNNVSPEAKATTPDKTAPAAPTVTANNDGSVDITPPTDADTKTVDITYTPEGKTDPVTVTATKGDDGKWTVPADSGLKVDENGKITIPADKVKDGTDVTAKAKDETGNVSDPATGKTPGSGETAKPTIINGKAENDPSKTTTTVSGKTKPNTEVVIKDKDRNELGKATSDENGDFTTEVPKQEKGTKVTLTPKDGTPSEVTVTEKGGTITPEPLPIPDNYLRWPIYFAPTKTEAKPAPVLERHEAYINGYPDGTVRPDGKITRAEVSAIFARLTQKNTLAQFIAQYSDVKINDWFTDSIMKLSSKGILTGYPDGKFKPNRSITRAEFANIVSKYIKNPKAANETFTDVPMNHWAKNAIAMVKAEGWITGYPDGTFRPDAPITRAEAVSIVNRMFDRAADTNFVSVHDYEIKSYTDLNGGHWAYYEIMEATQTHNYEKLGVRVERWDNLVK